MQQTIIAEIIQHLAATGTGDPRSWRIGLTQDSQTTYLEQGRSGAFNFWVTDSLSDAQSIVRFFVAEMQLQEISARPLVASQTTYVFVAPALPPRAP